ncbi:hypothetical protein STEG23_016788, partial [Scotinomys teguina]
LVGQALPHSGSLANSHSHRGQKISVVCFLRQGCALTASSDCATHRDQGKN